MHSRRIEHFLQQQEHPVFRWMVMDGYGFYKGFFSQQLYIDQQRIPANLSPYARHVFDQGLGRGIWFAKGENIEQVITTIAAFPEARRADLWNGASFACAYAGSPLERESFERLWEEAGPYSLQLSLAGALAAKRRLGLGHLMPHTELACQVFCSLSAEMAAGVANDSLKNLPPETTAPLHKIWRERIATYFEARAAYVSEKTTGANIV
jgi:enediyne biosynthesis protein E3